MLGRLSAAYVTGLNRHGVYWFRGVVSRLPDFPCALHRPTRASTSVKNTARFDCLSRCAVHTAARHDASITKYCYTCGRLISPNHRNFAERKYCSKSCNAHKPSAVDRELEDLIVQLASQKGSVGCGEVERMFSARMDSLKSEDGVNLDVLLAHVARQTPAEWRETVRRAARRVVVFGRYDMKFECVQNGKIVEPSFAKGEWSVIFKELRRK